MQLTIQQALEKAIAAHEAGRTEVADHYYRAIVKVEPNHPDANYNLGVLVSNSGNISSSLPFFYIALEVCPHILQFWISYIDALLNVDQYDLAREKLIEAKQRFKNSDELAMLISRVEECEICPQSAAPDKPRLNILAVRNVHKALELGFNFLQAGNCEQAQIVFRDILDYHPDNANAIAGLGLCKPREENLATNTLEPESTVLLDVVALINQGQYRSAIEHIDELLKIYPASTNLYNLLGSSQIATNDVDSAISSYQNAVTLKPDFAPAQYNLANALLRKNEITEAISHYEIAIALKPDYYDALLNLGIANTRSGNIEPAINCFNKAISIDSHNNLALSELANLLHSVRFNKHTPELYQSVIEILNSNRVARPEDFASSIVSLIKHDPIVVIALNRLRDNELESNLEDTVTALGKFHLLTKLMSVCAVPDIELEVLFRELRSKILKKLRTIPESHGIVSFQLALSLQCYLNEFIYSETEAEQSLVSQLIYEFSQNITERGDYSQIELLCIASYKSIGDFAWSEKIAYPNEIQELFLRQVSEPAQEASLVNSMPLLVGGITPDSVAVRQQYEESPYPKWQSLHVMKSCPIVDLLSQAAIQFDSSKLNFSGDLNILVAGCGTGRQAITTASRFDNCTVLAIDLSLRSLAFAKRKATEFGTNNIKFAQADILQLNGLDELFDVIESVGVLHHLKNPTKGLSVLTKNLKPGGLLKLGLYSRIARKHVSLIRDQISRKGINSERNAIKAFRDSLISNKRSSINSFLHSPDFYTLSSFRDLFFHVEEHQFSLLEIESMLESVKLRFCGFESNQTVDAFKATNPNFDDLYNLKKWHDFELERLEIFNGMYIFWCQKV